MESNDLWLDDPETFRVNRLPAHSDHVCYAGKEDYEADRRTLYLSLSGKWQFHYAKNPAQRPKDLWSDEAYPDTIAVPGHIELAGYGQIQYSNAVYPWDGCEQHRPPYTDAKKTLTADFSVAENNPVGTYKKSFHLPQEFVGKRVHVCFEGAEQAMYVWLNGSFVGYATDSFTPSWFDLTPYIRQENVLVVQLFKRSVAGYLEDQDFFRFFGLFRDVKLFALPKLHMQDVKVQTALNENLSEGTVRTAVQMSADPKFSAIGCSLSAALKSPEGEVLWETERPLSEKDFKEDACVEIESTPVKEVRLWAHLTPVLYRLELCLRDAKGSVVELTSVRVGFREIKIRDGVLYLNQKRLVLCGVNRHEWNPRTGRAVTEQDMEADIAVLQKNHINAVRTSHYPNNLRWYDLCDENGIYLCAEVNLESHGSWQRPNAIDASWNVPGDFKRWEGIVLDRAKTVYETYKNHPSILFWSLGNEAYAGEGTAAMCSYFRKTDPARVVHYESVYWRQEYLKRCTDVYSRMYATPEELAAYIEQGSSMPVVLCEYMHDMGNSLGGMDSYMALLDRYEQFQGGFIWDLIDQALYRIDPATGREVLGYGGDFNDRPSNYEFSGNGILFADRTEKPAMQEVRYQYGKYAES